MKNRSLENDIASDGTATPGAELAEEEYEDVDCEEGEVPTEFEAEGSSEG